MRTDELDERKRIVEWLNFPTRCRLLRRRDGRVGTAALVASCRLVRWRLRCSVRRCTGATRCPCRTRRVGFRTCSAARSFRFACDALTHGTTHGSAHEEDPSDTGNRFAADESIGFEEPGMHDMQFLERVVREDGCVDLFGDLQDERVTATDCSCGWRQEFAGEERLFILGPFRRIDAIGKSRVHHDDEILDGVLGEERFHGFIELAEAGGGSALCREVGTVNDHMGSDHGEKSLPFVPRCCGNRLNRYRAHRLPSTLQDPVREARPTSWLACSPGPAERCLGLLGASSLRFDP